LHLNSRSRTAVNFQIGKYEECIKDCEEAISVGREHRASFSLIARALVRIGNAHYKLGNLEAALEAYRNSQTEERSRETAKLINKVEQEKVRKDEQDYINPELAVAAKERGNAAYKENNYPEALKEYSEGISRCLCMCLLSLSLSLCLGSAVPCNWI
jgi:stress-induced-phosphoprotein 1